MNGKGEPMRLIDADALLRPISCYDPVKYTYEYGDVVTVQDIKSIPTIDAVPVIRCKDCVHYKGHLYCETWNNSPGFPAVTEDGFCNMAERRTDVTLNRC